MHRPEYFFRLAARLHRRRIAFLPRFFDRINELLFHVYLPHRCVVGNNMELGYHGVGVNVHADATLGDNVFLSPFVVIYPSEPGRPAPSIGNNVFISTGAKIIGDVTIGDGAVIGANAVVTKSVPARAIAAGIPARVTRQDIDVREVTGWPYQRK
jgi:serine O-acetyltransferase